MNSRCTMILHYRAVGEHGRCGKPAQFEDVTGGYCDEHWPARWPAPVWYANGLAYGWDETRRDPGLEL